jgi:hypothetical protein
VLNEEAKRLAALLETARAKQVLAFRMAVIT